MSLPAAKAFLVCVLTHLLVLDTVEFGNDDLREVQDKWAGQSMQMCCEAGC
jgi:hypothetical protein